MIKFNPFNPNSVVKPGMFVGRTDELTQIEKCLFQTRHGNPRHFLLQGERGIGKTSLLFYLHHEATGTIAFDQGEDFNFIVNRIELRESMNYADIVSAIIYDLKNQINKQQKIKARALKALEFLSKFEAAGVRYNRQGHKEDKPELLNQLSELLLNLIEEAGSIIDGILILIDEADKPGPEANLGEFVKLLTERLTREDCNNVCIGLAGLPNLVPTLRKSHESSPRVFSILNLEPLSRQECESVVQSGIDAANTENAVETKVTDGAKGLIASLSEGYPHFLQEFAFWSFDIDQDNVIDEDDVLDGAFRENGALDQLGTKYFNTMYLSEIGSDDYRTVLTVMAQHLDDWVTRQEIIAESGLKKTTIGNALRAMKTKNIIVANEARRGEYKLPTKSFAAWIRARNRVEDVAGNGDRIPGL